mmetsp:Transcript_16569/g.64715  ORF Transcript_16569/g.64715 Transcript_16569/m.64715 type:complete len:218 (-) Transcript_16569:404-1057(-)
MARAAAAGAAGGRLRHRAHRFPPPALLRAHPPRPPRRRPRGPGGGLPHGGGHAAQAHAGAPHARRLGGAGPLRGPPLHGRVQVRRRARADPPHARRPRRHLLAQPRGPHRQVPRPAGAAALRLGACHRLLHPRLRSRRLRHGEGLHPALPDPLHPLQEGRRQGGHHRPGLPLCVRPHLPQRQVVAAGAAREAACAAAGELCAGGGAVPLRDEPGRGG